MGILQEISDKVGISEEEIEGQSFDDFFILCEKRTNKKLKITSESLASNDYRKDNNGIIIYPDRGIKYGNYAEFNIIGGTECPNFKLGHVDVEISTPSALYELLVSQNGDKYYDRTFITTISLRGIDNTNLKDYMYQALFILGCYASDDYDNEYPVVAEFIGEEYYRYALPDFYIDRTILSEFNDKSDFSAFDHTEVLSFYNAGMEIRNHELSFQYFYKVLEYFFIINRSDDFKEKIQQYNSNNNIQRFIKEITNIYKDQEINQLQYLLSANSSDLKSILEFAKSNNLIDEPKSDVLAAAIYRYRNSIVHGKSDETLDLKLPNLLNNEAEINWIKIVHQISLILIRKYCLD
ncbi:hypothetical protein [Lactococcus petauri]|uniref:hypothetical protein n=1 Tax=Lactococcus petauri TaxID=1940789 RepID=UPI00326777EC